MRQQDQREGFVYLPSFQDSVSRLPDELRLKAYDAICGYGVNGTIDEEDPVILCILSLVQPIIDGSKRKRDASRENGSKGGRPKMNLEEPGQNPAKPEPANEKPNENQEEEEEVEEEEEPIPPTPQGDGCGQEDEGFTRFWDAYPRKQKKQAARKAFGQALGKVSLADMLQALEQQRSSPQWNRDDGRPMGAPTAGTGDTAERWDFRARAPASPVIARSAATRQSVLLGTAPVRQKHSRIRTFWGTDCHTSLRTGSQ